MCPLGVLSMYVLCYYSFSKFKILLVIIIIITIINNFSHVSPVFLTLSLISVYTLNVMYVCDGIADKRILVSCHLDLLGCEGSIHYGRG